MRLVLLPGMDGTGRLFGRFLRVLPPEHRATVATYPGERFVDYAGLADHVRTLLPRESPFGAFLLGREAPDDLVRETVDVILSVRPEVLASRLRMVLAAGPADRSRHVSVPVLCLQGRRDRLLGRRGLRTVLDLKPDTAVVEIDGPHLLLQTKPEEALRRISLFLGEDRRPGDEVER